MESAYFWKEGISLIDREPQCPHPSIPAAMAAWDKRRSHARNALPEQPIRRSQQKTEWEILGTWSRRLRKISLVFATWCNYRKKLPETLVKHFSYNAFKNWRSQPKTNALQASPDTCLSFSARGSMTLGILHAVNCWPLRTKLTVLLSAPLDTTSQVKSSDDDSKSFKENKLKDLMPFYRRESNSQQPFLTVFGWIHGGLSSSPL